MALTQITWQPSAPITSNGRYIFEGLGIEFYNAGDEVITLNTHWTIPVGGLKTIALDGIDKILLLDISVAFDGTGVNPRLEVAELTVDTPEHANYSKKRSYG